MQTHTKLPIIERLPVFEERFGLSFLSIEIEHGWSEWEYQIRAKLVFDYAIICNQTLCIVVGGYDSEGNLVVVHEHSSVNVNFTHEHRSESLELVLMRPQETILSKIRIFPQLLSRSC